MGRVSRSAFVEYHDKAATPLCETLLPLLDEHARRIGGLVGYEPESSETPIRYYKFLDKADSAAIHELCGEGVVACARDSSVYSPIALHAHELAHVYTFRAWGGWSTGLLNEGEATALACEPAIEEAHWVGPPPDWRELLDLHDERSTGYVFAASLIKYLASNFGWQSVGELHRRIPRTASALDFEREFARVYPMSMDEAWSAAQSNPGMACFPDWLCMATPLTEGETVDPDCDGEWHRSIRVASQPGIVLSFAGEGLFLTDCGSLDAIQFLDGSSKAGQRSVHWASVPPGNYVINNVLYPTPSAVSLERYLSRPLLGESCDDAGTVELGEEAQTFIDLPPRPTSGWIQLRGGGRSYLLDSPAWTAAAGAVVELCERCGSDQVCSEVSQSYQAAVVVSDQAAIHLRKAWSSPWTQLRFVPVSP